MLKYFLIALSLMSVTSFADLKGNEAARICAATYEQDTPKLIGDYQLANIKSYPHQNDLKFVTYINHKSKEYIVAYKGTDPTNLHNILVDIAIFKENGNKNTHRINGKLQPSTGLDAISLLKNWQDWFKTTTISHGNPAIKTMAPGVSDLIIDTARDSTFAAFSDMAIDGTQKIVDMKKLLDEAVTKALGYYHKMKIKFPSYKGHVTGHSKGGFYAQIVAASTGEDGSSYNAPGALSYIKQNIKTVKQSAFQNYSRQHDIIGKLGEHFGTTILIADIPFEKALDVQSSQQSEKNLYQKVKNYVAHFFNVKDRKKFMWRYLLMNHGIKSFASTI